MKCDHCPIAGDERPCFGERHSRICENADPDSPNHLPAIIAKIVGYTDNPPPPAGTDEAPRPLPSAVREQFARMKACPHFTSSTDCGCGKNRCSLGRGDRGVVSHKDCFDCPQLPPAPPA